MNQLFRNIVATDFAKRDRYPMITIIIAAYNAEELIDRALKSCTRQTYRNIEIIVVDDGSEDRTAEIVRATAESDPRVMLISRPNGGQGIARNQALDVATGEYITIVDADDELQERALEVMVKQALLTRADLVVGMMTHILPDGRSLYQPMFEGKRIDIFSVNERKRLLKETYFTQGRLYRKAMLDENNVRYGEGYIYEDVEFVLGSVLFSKRISALPNPVYKLRVTEGSTTRAKHDTDWHSKSFAKAIESSVQKYGDEFDEVADAFVTYTLNRTMAYVKGGRVGRQFKRKFYTDITRSLRSLKDDYSGVRLSGIHARSLSFSKFSPSLGFVFLLAQRQVIALLKHPSVARALKVVSKTFAPVVDPMKIRRSRRRKAKLRKKALAEGFKNNMILFHGFDGEIRGNTKYVLEEFSKAGYECYVVSKTPKVVPGVKVLKLWSEEFHRIAAKARFHVLETWGNLAIGKYPGAVWIQMWHGTPIKKLLLDSPEVDITKVNPKHVMMKLRDIARWDRLIAQNDFCKRALSSAFAYDSDKIEVCGYPRMLPLLDEAIVAEKTASIRQKYGVPHGKKSYFTRRRGVIIITNLPRRTSPIRLIGPFFQ